jgi:hypothetical protein
MSLAELLHFRGCEDWLLFRCLTMQKADRGRILYVFERMHYTLTVKIIR